MTTKVTHLVVPSRRRRIQDGIVFGGATGLVVAVALHAGLGWQSDVSAVVAAGVACAVAVVLGVATARVLRARVEVGPSEVTVFGALRTRRIPLDDLAGIEEGRLRAQPCLYLVERGGARRLVPPSLIEGGREEVTHLRLRLCRLTGLAQVE